MSGNVLKPYFEITGVAMLEIKLEIICVNALGMVFGKQEVQSVSKLDLDIKIAMIWKLWLESKLHAFQKIKWWLAFANILGIVTGGHTSFCCANRP